MKKKILAFLLAGSMIVSGNVTALAAELTDGSEEAVQETELLESGNGLTEPEVLSEAEEQQEVPVAEERLPIRFPLMQRIFRIRLFEVLRHLTIRTAMES